MPASMQDKITVVCPHCGNSQPEPRTVISTVCKKCRRNFSLEEAPKAARKTVEPARGERRHINCFDCGAELDVPLTAQSTMCKRCSRYLDLKDYHITNAVSKNFKTKGSFTLEATGYVFNTEAVVGDAVIRGRFLGKLNAERTLTIYDTATIKGTFTAGRLIVPAENHLRWPEASKVVSAEIIGELAANLHASGVIIVKSTGRVFGDLQGGSLVVEEGAVIVGHTRIGLNAGLI